MALTLREETAGARTREEALKRIKELVWESIALEERAWRVAVALEVAGNRGNADDACNELAGFVEEYGKLISGLEGGKAKAALARDVARHDLNREIHPRKDGM